MEKDRPPSEIAQARRGPSELLIPVLLVTAFLVLAGYYLSRPGLGWDESIDVPFAETYRQWFAGMPGSLAWERTYDTAGRYASHPPLARYAMALTMQVFANSMSRLYAARMATVVSAAVLIAAVYLFGVYIRGRLAAATACLSLILMPRFFAHGMLGSLDMQMSLWWFLSAAAFYVAMEKRKWAWAAGLAAALAFLTKINALALALVLWPWGFYFYRRRALPAVIWSAVLTPVLFVALWPFMWASPILGAGKYFGEKFGFVVTLYSWFGADLTSAGDALHRMMKRSDVTVLYFGKVYTSAPWHYPLVMTVITTPLGSLLAAAAGALRWSKEKAQSRLFSFLILNVVFWLFAFAAGLAKPYDGVRLFLLVFPFIALLAGIGIEWALGLLRRPGAPAWALVILAALFFVPQAYSFLSYEPFGLSYYNVLVGGLSGAERRGLPVTYWGETVNDEIFEYINTKAAEGAAVAIYPMERPHVENMRFFGLLRGDIKDVNTADDWDWLIIANRGDMLAARPDIADLTREAVVTKRIRGVPAAWLIERKR